MAGVGADTMHGMVLAVEMAAAKGTGTEMVVAAMAAGWTWEGGEATPMAEGGADTMRAMVSVGENVADDGEGKERDVDVGGGKEMVVAAIAAEWAWVEGATPCAGVVAGEAREACEESGQRQPPRKEVEEAARVE
jgi:hypothetical protein